MVAFVDRPKMVCQPGLYIQYGTSSESLFLQKQIHKLKVWPAISQLTTRKASMDCLIDCIVLNFIIRKKDDEISHEESRFKYFEIFLSNNKIT
jgi:hypothetical protein